MTTCQNCSGKTDSAFLCARCVGRLRDTLARLPALLKALTEAAIGAVNMSDNGGRKSARKTTLEIAKSLATITGTGEYADQRARTAREKMLRRVLASGGCNGAASLLLGTVAGELASWCQMLCEEKGLSYTPPTLTPWRDKHGDIHAPSYGEAHVRFLFANVKAIAQSDSAGDIMGDICGRDAKRPGYIADIERAIDYPTRWVSLGACPAPVRVEGPNVKGQPHPTAECGRKLRADSERTETRCPDCRTVHSIARLQLAHMAEADATPLTWDMLCRANKDQEPTFRVPKTTLYRWRDEGKLMPTTIDDEGNPLYAWADLQRIKAETRRGPKRKLVKAG